LGEYKLTKWDFLKERLETCSRYFIHRYCYWKKENKAGSNFYKKNITELCLTCSFYRNKNEKRKKDYYNW